MPPRLGPFTPSACAKFDRDDTPIMRKINRRIFGITTCSALNIAFGGAEHVGSHRVHVRQPVANRRTTPGDVSDGHFDRCLIRGLLDTLGPEAHTVVQYAADEAILGVCVTPRTARFGVLVLMPRLFSRRTHRLLGARTVFMMNAPNITGFDFPRGLVSYERTSSVGGAVAMSTFARCPVPGDVFGAPHHGVEQPIARWQLLLNWSSLDVQAVAATLAFYHLEDVMGDPCWEIGDPGYLQSVGRLAPAVQAGMRLWDQ